MNWVKQMIWWIVQGLGYSFPRYDEGMPEPLIPKDQCKTIEQIRKAGKISGPPIKPAELEIVLQQQLWWLIEHSEWCREGMEKCDWCARYHRVGMELLAPFAERTKIWKGWEIGT